MSVTAVPRDVQGDAPTADRRGYEVVKRALDLALASLIITAGLPVWFAIAALIRLTSPGPALYRGRVVGRHGREFTYLKFRTMYVDGDNTSHRQFLEAFVKSNQPYAVVRGPDGTERPVYKLINDPRITPVGRVLRKLALDEGPQLVNVLRGEMSIVGPRPPVPYEYTHYEPRHKRRLDVLPGITGLYQVTARSEVPFEEMVRIDLEYVRRRSLWLDVSIMLRTVQVMLAGRGAY